MVNNLKTKLQTDFKSKVYDNILVGEYVVDVKHIAIGKEFIGIIFPTLIMLCL